MKLIPTTFKGRIFLSIACLIIFTSIAFLSFFVFRSGAIVRDKLRDRGILIVKDLTVTSGRNFALRDEVALNQKLLDMIRRENDILYAFLYDKNGNLIASETKTQIENTLSKDMQKTAQEKGIWIGRISTSLGKVYDFVSPVRGPGILSMDDKDRAIGYARIGLSLGSVYAERRIAVSVGSLIVLCLIGVGFLISNIVASRISEPTTGLAKVIADVENGNLTTQISFEGEDDEIGKLGAGINNMIKRLDDLVKAERKSKEKEIAKLKEIERLEKYNEDILENLKSGIVVTDEKLNVLTWNNYMVKNYGVGKKEVVGKSFLECFPKLKEEGFDKIFARVLKGKSYRDYMKKHETKNKGVRYFNVAFTPRKDAEGKIIGILMNWDDVTERKQAEEALWIKDSAIASSINAMAIADLEGNLTYVNNSFLKLWGYDDVKEVLGKPAVKFWQMEEGALKVVEALKNKGSWIGELVAMRKDSSLLDIQLSASMVKDAAGKPICMMASFVDITERKRAEESLQRKTCQQEQLLETARHLTASLDTKEVLTRIGIGAKEILKAHGCAIYLLEPDGKTLTPVVAIEPPHEKEILSTPLKVSKSFTGKAVRAKRGLIFNDAGNDSSGRQIPGTPVEKGERLIVVPFIVDDKVLGAMCLKRIGTLFSEEDLSLSEAFATYAATALKNAQAHDDLQHEVEERKLAEAKLTEKRKYLRALLESAADAVASLDNKNRIVEWNKAAEKMFGYRKEEVVGRNIDDIIAPGEKHQEAALMTKRTLIDKETVNFESTRYRKDGIPVEVMVSGAPIITDDEVTGVVTVYKNITARKILERQLKEAAQTLERKVNERTKELRQAYDKLKKTQEELVRKERLAVLGQLAGGVGHELRNPLGVIKNAAYFLNMKLNDIDDKVRKHLGIIDREIFTANEIITNLLDFSRVKPPQRANVHIDTLIKGVLDKSYIPHYIKTVIEIPEDIPSVSVDSGQIERVLLNVITNAVQAMHESGELKIQSEGVDGFVSIDISDTGEGIPKEVMSKMFQPLFTTKAKGIGLGLTVCKSLLEANGGSISVQSELRKGTTVSVQLPLNNGGIDE